MKVRKFKHRFGNDILIIAMISTVFIASCKTENVVSQPGTKQASVVHASGSTVTTAAASTYVRQHLLFENTFENATDMNLWATQEKAFANSIVISNTVTHTGHSSMQVLVNKTDPIVTGGIRAEVTLKQEPVVKVERWIGYSIYLPSSFIIDPEPEIIQQWHDMPDLAEGGVWRSPPFALMTQNGRWSLSVRWSAARLTSDETTGGKIYDLGRYRNSVWTNWVFHIRSAWDSTGLIEVWQNGVLVLTINGPNAYNDNTGNYFKMGVYKWVWMPGKDTGTSTTTSREVYYDDVRIGDQYATYKDVAP